MKIKAIIIIISLMIIYIIINHKNKEYYIKVNKTIYKVSALQYIEIKLNKIGEKLDNNIKINEKRKMKDNKIIYNIK